MIFIRCKHALAYYYIRWRCDFKSRRIGYRFEWLGGNEFFGRFVKIIYFISIFENDPWHKNVHDGWKAKWLYEFQAGKRIASNLAKSGQYFLAAIV
jgi:hypothetical protein